MKTFLKYLGPILVLIGVAMLAFAQFSGILTNGILISVLLIFIVSIVVEITFNKHIE